MKQNPKVGTTGELRFVADQKHATSLTEDGPAVLSTPWLIWFLEHAARDALPPFLDDNEGSVGIHVDLQHLAATPLGQEVVCTARVIHVDGTLISFQFEAHDEDELIARGTHKRKVVRVDRFAAAVARKTK